MNMSYRHDGAPFYFLRLVCQCLEASHHSRWIGSGVPDSWTTRSRNFKLLKYYSWGHMKDLVYIDTVPGFNTLCQLIFNQCDYIRKQTNVFLKLRHCLIKRKEAFIVSDGSHFEHLLREGLCCVPPPSSSYINKYN